jgi:hypothetical protein
MNMVAFQKVTGIKKHYRLNYYSKRYPYQI